MKKYILKSLVDKLLTLLILPFFLILHVVIFFLVKIDSAGVVLFRQKRLGKNSTDFDLFKYRTMYSNGDEILKEYLLKNPDEVIYYDEYHKYKNDPRITKIGKFLRSSSLDELPQILNVLKNDMSLIGPRPYMLNESKKIGKSQDTILSVKPGITGLWQVSGRNKLTFNNRVELDVWYVENCSLWIDVKILLKTIKVVLLKIGSS